MSYTKSKNGAETQMEELARGVLTEELTKDEWAKRFWPEEDNELRRYQNIQGLLQRCHAKEKYIYAIPDGEKQVLKDITKSKVNFFYVYGKIVAAATQQHALAMKMGKAIIEKYPDMAMKVKAMAALHMGDVTKEAGEKLNIYYAQSTKLFTK